MATRIVKRGDLVAHGPHHSMYVVLAVSDGYVVLRRKDQKPLVVAEAEVERWVG
jgi:hypothetical protein